MCMTTSHLLRILVEVFLGGDGNVRVVTPSEEEYSHKVYYKVAPLVEVNN